MCTKISKKLFKFLQQFSMLNITKMRQKYKNKDLLKNQPFYSSEIESSEKNNKKISNIKFLSELPFSSKEPKELTNIELSKELPFPQKKSKRSQKINSTSNITEYTTFV